jgi:predicted lipid-binding transport protein (Tim44 family)
MGLRGEMMGWLLDNALADMPGTSFLMFYGIAACIVLIGAYFVIDMQAKRHRRAQRWQRDAPQPERQSYPRGRPPISSFIL